MREGGWQTGSLQTVIREQLPARQRHKIKDIHRGKHSEAVAKAVQQEDCVANITLHTLTVREVKVMHMPPKPLKVRAMKIRTESSVNKTDNSSGVCQQQNYCTFMYI